MSSFYWTKKGGGGLNANISQYLAIKYTTEAYICVKIAYYVINQLNNGNIEENRSVLVYYTI